MCIISALQKDATKMAHLLVEKRAAACAQVSSPIRSFYWWQEKIEESQEVFIFLKTEKNKITEIQNILNNIHPYQVYEFIVLPIKDGNPGYLQWITDSLKHN